MTTIDGNATEPGLRNVLFIMCDQLRWDASGTLFLKPPTLIASPKKVSDSIALSSTAPYADRLA